MFLAGVWGADSLLTKGGEEEDGDGLGVLDEEGLVFSLIGDILASLLTISANVFLFVSLGGLMMDSF